MTTPTPDAGHWLCPACNHRIEQHGARGCMHGSGLFSRCACTARRAALENVAESPTPWALLDQEFQHVKGDVIRKIAERLELPPDAFMPPVETRGFLAVDPADPRGRVYKARGTAGRFEVSLFGVTTPDELPSAKWISEFLAQKLAEQLDRDEHILEPLFLRMVYGDGGAHLGIMIERTWGGGIERAWLASEEDDPRVLVGGLTYIELPPEPIDWNRRIGEWHD